ncbi:MAG: hypothetical protein H6620_12320 [Halobacteriovoraceae bacterium]|nr:hypothetical protein [Halobacteriovoraceae bacterium]
MVNGKKKFYICSLVLIGLLVGCFIIFNLSLSKKTYFGRYSVHFSNNNTPVIKVEIEGKYYPLVFDSGSCFQMSLLIGILNELDSEPYGTKTWLDVKGTEYTNHKYLMKELKLEPFTFTNVTVVSIPTYQSVQVWKGEEENNRIKPVGDFGYGLINKCNWLLDLHNYCIIASNNLKKLKKSGYKLEKPKLLPQKVIEKAGINIINLKTNPRSVTA